MYFINSVQREKMRIIAHDLKRVKAPSSNEKIKNFKFKKDRKKNNEEEVN